MFLQQHKPSVVVIATITALAQMIFVTQTIAASENVSVETIAVVRLLPQADVGTRIVSLGDIATITTSHVRLAARLESLDVVELPESKVDEPKNGTIVTRQHVAVRLILAGFDREQIEVVGADKVAVRRGHTRHRDTQDSDTRQSRERQSGQRRLIATPQQSQRDNQRDNQQTISDAAVEAVATQIVAENLGLTTADVSVRLTSPLLRGQPNGHRHRCSHFDVTPISNVQPGRVSLLVRFFDGGQLLSTRRINVDVAIRQSVLVAAHTITSGQDIADTAVVEQTRFITEQHDQLPRSRVIGRTARGRIPVGAIIETRHLAESQVAKNEDNVIAARDLVRLTVRSGRLKVIMPVAEAMEKGRVGQLIRVRNTSSNKIITGRVVAAGEVEVPLN